MYEVNSPSSLSIFTLFLCSIISVLFFFIFLLSNTRSRSRTKTPCPQSHPIIGNLLGFLRNRHRFHDWVTEMLSQTPSSTLQVNSFLNLSPHGICTSNPKNVEHLLSLNFPNYIKGSRFHNVLDELLGHGIFNVDGHNWVLQRKIASNEFNTKSLKHFISDVVRSEISNRLLPYLLSNENNVIDLQQVLQNFTFNNICNVAFGVDPESEIYNNSGFIKAFDDAVDICSSRFMSPVTGIWKMKRFLNIGSEKRFKESIKVINDYVNETIVFKSKEKSKQDLLSRFISISSNMEFQNQQHRTKFLRDIVISFILAGKDTTATALTWFFWLIAGNIRVACLIRAELSSLGSESESPRIFCYDELKKMHYLQAALSESMRLFPPVPINSKLTIDDDVLPDGTYVGKGWFADYSAYAMGRNEKIWGDDCMEFKPERWLDCDDGVFQYQPLDQFRFPVFHCGPRLCLGKEMAYVQMKSIAAVVMNEFEIVAVDGGASAEKMMKPPYVLSLLLKMKGGFPVRLRRRKEK